MTKTFRYLILYAISILCIGCSSDKKSAVPPMGWNSWICYGTSVTEDEVKETADFMAANLKSYGWEYLVIDAGWYAPGMVSLEHYLDPHPLQLIDDFGRLIADPAKYPSGLKGLSEYIHSKGLKMGIHIMRGMPVQAYEQNTPIKGTDLRARDIADTLNLCDWYYGFVGIDMSVDGAAAYYDSLFELYKDWGVDYVKADDLLSPSYAHVDIDAISKAAQQAGIVLSLSPGPAPIEMAEHLRESCTLWRISEDFWDSWDSLKEQFDLASRWISESHPGAYPDLDMLPIGPMALRAMRGEPRMSNFTRDEQRSMLSLWAVFHSPLMVGCALPQADDFTLSLLTNRDIIEIDQFSVNNRELKAGGDIRVWAASSPDGKYDYLAVFNLSDEALEDYNAEEFASKSYRITLDIWSGEKVNINNLDIAPHGVAMLKLKK